MSKIGDTIRKAFAIRGEAIKEKLPAYDAREAYMPPMTLATPKGNDEKAVIAMDSSLDGLGIYGLVAPGLAGMYGVPAFLGYPTLSNLSQNGLIRAGVESVSDEMTRKWLDLQTTGEDDNSDLPADLMKELERMRARQVFNDAATKVGYFGGCLVFLDMGDSTDAELLTPLVLDPAKVRKGSLKRLTVVEPINLYPGQYNASDPLSPDYFTPSTWRVLGREIHASRFLYFAANVPPLLLRPAYNFFGIPMAQIALDYVAGFTGNRESATRLLEKFSLTVWSTNMASFLSGGDVGEGIDTRVAYAVQQRSNDGVMTLDKESETIEQINTPLTGVTDIVKMSLELLSAIFRVPAVKLFGISPQGFNATGEADMRNWYDHVSSQQEKVFGAPMERLLQFVQLSLFGKVDESVAYKWLPLWEMDPAQAATIRKTDVDTAVALVTGGVVSPDEVRTKLAQDEESGWEGLDLSVELIEPNADPVDEGGELAQDADRWITVHPNGPDVTGQPALIGEGGEVKAGMGGKFNGQKIGDIPRTFRSEKQAEKKQEPAKAAAPTEPVTVREAGANLGAALPPRTEHTSAGGAKLVAEGQSIKLIGSNGKEKDITWGNGDFTYSAQMHPDVAKQIRASGKDPADFVSMRGTVMPKEIADAILEHAGKLREHANANLQRNVPGLEELRAAKSARAAHHEDVQRRLDDENMSSNLPAAPTGAEELAAKYPRAALYLKADTYAGASNDKKATAGEKAKKILAEGGPEKEAAEMLDTWHMTEEERKTAAQSAKVGTSRADVSRLMEKARKEGQFYVEGGGWNPAPVEAKISEGLKDGDSWRQSGHTITYNDNALTVVENKSGKTVQTIENLTPEQKEEALVTIAVELGRKGFSMGTPKF